MINRYYFISIEWLGPGGNVNAKSWLSFSVKSLFAERPEKVRCKAVDHLRDINGHEGLDAHVVAFNRV